VDFIKTVLSINIKYTKTTSRFLDELSSHPSSPLASSTLYSTKIDRALYIFFRTIGSKNFSLEKINKVSRSVFQAKDTKGGEIPISAAKIGQGRISEVLIAIYLSCNNKFDLIESLDNENLNSDEREKDFRKGITTFIENTIEYGAPSIRKELIDDNHGSPQLTLTSFLRRIKRNDEVKL